MDNLDIDELFEQSGAHYDGSFVDPSEAGYNMALACIEPLLDDMARRVTLGVIEQARAIVVGVVTALHERKNQESESVLQLSGGDVAYDLALDVI